MKKVSLLIFALILLLVFVACQPKDEACTHEWTAATCTAPKTCTKCNATEGAAAGHDWAAATCTAAKTCKTCKVTEGSPLGHTEVTLEAKDPTCTETGLTAGKKCSVCNTVTQAQQTVPATGHDLVQHSAKEATCTEGGWNAYETCNNCDYNTKVEVGAHGHTEEVIPAVDPTCTETGLTAGKKCTVCNTVTVEQEVVPATGHNNDVTIPGTAATCGTAGLTDGKKCSVCGTTTVPQEEIPATGAHIPMPEGPEPDLSKAPTCTEDGYTVHAVRCLMCENIISQRQEVIPATGHTINNDGFTSNNDATCEADGTKTGTCSICNESFTVTDEDTAFGHKMPESTACGEMWTCENGCGETFGPREHSMAPATCTANSTCTLCGHEEENTKLEHTAGAPEDEIVSNPGCETEGSKNVVVKCTVCGTVLSSTPETIPATGHKMAPATCDSPSTCENGCGHTEGEKVANHTPVATVDGAYLTYTCATCNDTFTTDQALIYDGSQSNYSFVAGSGSDIAMKAENGQYNVLAGNGATKSQYMIYLPYNDRTKPGMMTEWNDKNESFGVFSFRVNLNVDLKNEAFRVIVMSARNNPNWDANGSWSGNSIDILAFMPNFDGDTFNGTYRVYGNAMTSNTFATVNANEWVDVKMFMQINSEGLFTISYYINGEFCNVYTKDLKDPNASMSIKNLDINCAYICGWTNPGTGFALDDVYLGYAKNTEWLFDEHEHRWVDADCETPKHCSACGLTEGDPLGHTEATRNANVVAPDCVNGGSHDVETYCTVCNKVLDTEHVEDAALGHKPNENNVCTVCGVDLHECNLVADEVVPPTCTDGGYTVYRCDHPGCTKFENRDFTEPAGHTMNAATCTAPKTCSVCGHTEGEALGHSYSAPSCAAAQTCTVCGATQGQPNANAHKLTSTYENGKLTYSCSVCDYNFNVDTFDYLDGTHYNGMGVNAGGQKDYYSTNTGYSNPGYPVLTDGYYEFVRNDAEAGVAKQLQVWLPTPNAGANKFSGFTSGNNSIGYLSFDINAYTDHNLEMKLVGNITDNYDANGDGTAESIRWNDLWAINNPVFAISTVTNGKAEVKGFGNTLKTIEVGADNYTGWFKVAIQLVLDPDTDKVIAHYYLDGEYVGSYSQPLTIHYNGIQNVYVNSNNKNAGTGWKMDNITFGYTAHKHDLVPTVENGVLTYNCACGTNFVVSSELREWDGEGEDSPMSHSPNGKVNTVKNDDGTWGFMFQPSGTQEEAPTDWGKNGDYGAQIQPWMPTSNETGALTGFSCENNAVGIISFSMKTSMVRGATADTSFTLNIGKARNAADWSGWNTSQITILTVEEYVESGTVVKGGLNGTNLNLATIPAGGDGWSEWFDVAVVIEMNSNGYIHVYYYINGAYAGTDSRDLNNPGGNKTLDTKKIQALQFSGWTYAANTGVMFDDMYFGYTVDGHNTLDGQPHKLTETTCGEKSTCSCGWTGYTVAHTFATDCAPACSVCGLANEHAAAHAHLSASVVSDGVAYVCSDCNYAYTVKSTNGHNLGDISDLSVREEYERTYDGTYFKLINLGTANAQHQFWIPGQTESPKFAECSNANESTVFLSFSINAKDHHNTGIEFKVNANRNTGDWGGPTNNGWSESSVGVFRIKPTTDGATTVALGGYNGADLGSIAITGENGWTGWIDVVVVMHLNKDNTITVEYYINGSLFKTLHADFVIWTHEINSLYVNGRTNEGQGFELKNFFFGYTNEGMAQVAPEKEPIYKSEIAKDDVTNDLLKAIVDSKFKQCDQCTTVNAQGGTPVYVLADKNGEDVQALYVSRTYAWTGDEAEDFTEFRFDVDGSKKATKISFDYKISGTVGSNSEHQFTGLDGTKFYTDAYVQVKTPSNHPLAGDNYPELQGTDLVLDGEWHTMEYTFAEPLEIINILLNLYQFQGELLIANLNVEFVEG